MDEKIRELAKQAGFNSYNYEGANAKLFSRFAELLMTSAMVQATDTGTAQPKTDQDADNPQASRVSAGDLTKGNEMRKLDIGTEKYTVVFAADNVEYNSNHQYKVRTTEAGDELLHINFQKGPIKECGVNGIMNEDLIAIVIDRLQGFQASPFACRENALAITKLEEALHWLRHRTVAREKRGVEGTHVI